MVGSIDRRIPEARPPIPALSPEALVDMYREMLLARHLDERMWLLVRQGKGPFLISCRGHEGVMGSAFALRREYDFFLPYYRDLAVVLHLGQSPVQVLMGFLARAQDPSSGGRQMPMHWSSRHLHIVSHSSPVATQIPHAVGIALASRLKGEDRVTVVYFGDGAASKGDFHEGLNFAAVWKLPVIFLVENNGYAISVPHRKQMAIQSIAERAAGYGFPGVSVDGADPVAVYMATWEAAQRARRGEGPTLIEARVPRLSAHSSDDDQRAYRSPEELEQAQAQDPLACFQAYLFHLGLLTPDAEKAMGEEIARELDEAQAQAEASPLPDPQTLWDHVLAA